ncbi:MAG: fimbrial protein [Pararobbsia sp.]
MLSFDGKVTAQTCKINGLDKNANLTVKLPTVSTSALVKSGDTAGTTPFELKLTECKTASGTAFPHFEPGASIDPTTGRLINTGTGNGLAENVQVALLNENLSPIDLKAAPLMQNVKIGELKPITTGSGADAQTTGEATLKFFAQYVATGGAATAGIVNTTVQYAMMYE